MPDRETHHPPDAERARNGGLHRPHGALEEFEPPGRRSPRRIAIQIVGVVISIGLLIWAVSLALQPENRENLERLAQASPGVIALLVGLVLTTVVLNGLIFKLVLGHTHRLGAVYLVAVTGVATLLTYAPFKLSLVARAFIHRRRDRLRYRTIVSWFAATSGLTMCVLGPATLVSVWRTQLDLIWALGAVGGPILACGLAVVVARRVRDMPKMHAATLGAAEYATSVPRVAAVVLLRFADLGAIAWRFWIAAGVLGIELTIGESVVAASVYFLVGVLSPSGNLGAREGAVTGVGFLPALGNADQLALIALVVTGAEIAGALIAGFLGVIFIRPDRLLKIQPPSGENDTSRSDERPER